MKGMYKELTKALNLDEVLQKHLEECTKYKASKEEYIKKMPPTKHNIKHMHGTECGAPHKADSLNITNMIDEEIQKFLNEEYNSKSWNAKIEEFKKLVGDLGTEGKKLIDVQNLIKDIEKLLENSSDCILDCYWKRYFDEPSINI